MSEILAAGKSPEAWAKAFAERGLKISPRQLRADARRIGACIVYGKAMILMPDHIDMILADAAATATPPATRLRPKPAVGDTVAKALAHLERCRKGR